MRKPTPILLTVTFLLILSMACAVSGLPAPTQDISLLGTLVMQTMAAGATQTALAVVPVEILDTPTAAPTIIPEFPTLSPTVTLTATPAFTATPLIPLISVSVPTNCRVGPGKVYDRVGGLQVGQVAEVVGRNALGNYWYIRNPSRDGFCWLWGEYATVTGNFAALPVFTPPPTPTPMPAFQAAYDGLESCGSSWWTDFELVNTGGISFESISLTVRDTETDIVASMYTDVFHDIDGCSETFTRDSLPTGDSRIVSAAAFTYNPTGHRLRATITLCSRDGQNGTCITESIRFTP
jgi:hypothetical protein